MKLKSFKLAPALITIGVAASICFFRVKGVEWFQRLERITYDARVQYAQHLPFPVATNLGAVLISDKSIEALNDGSIGFKYGSPPWPRHVYGRVLRELTAQGANAVAFDVMFAELRPIDNPVQVAGPKRPDAGRFLRHLYPHEEPTTYELQGDVFTQMESDDYFAWQLHQSGVAILAAEQGVPPHPLFATNTMAVGDISADSDPDGVLRKACAFKLYTNWHDAFLQLQADREDNGTRTYGVNLSKAEFQPGRIILPRKGADPIEIPVDSSNQFQLSAFFGTNLPAGTLATAPAFTVRRVWHMGIILAAGFLGLDLENAEVDLSHGRIVLRGSNGLERVIPVDEHGYFYINWQLTALDPRLQCEPFEKLLWQDQHRLAGDETGPKNQWQKRLVVIGSSATGNNLTDHGATPLEKDTLLVSKHWNVANSIITGQFIKTCPLSAELILIVALTLIAAFLTWSLRAFLATASVALLATAYGVCAFYLYVEHRFWLPMVLPIGGAMLSEHVLLVTYRVFFEESEKRRVKSIFSRIVAPDVVNELLKAEKLGLGGARREVTVLFADVRGFTELTDVSHERVATYVQENKLTGAAAEACFDEAASETLNTVNLYLARVADTVKLHNGTLDKYIGDCVMAFWGAPTPNPRHAVACVRAAVDAQRAINELNQLRAEQNLLIEEENKKRQSEGQPPKPLHATLMLGTGINTGPVTVGLMGSEAHILNYTVFGREVNLASRLEHESGRGRIVISETTFQHLQRADAVLAATCVQLEPVMVKGIRTAVKIYEVPWKTSHGTESLKKT